MKVCLCNDATQYSKFLQLESLKLKSGKVNAVSGCVRSIKERSRFSLVLLATTYIFLFLRLLLVTLLATFRQFT